MNKSFATAALATLVFSAGLLAQEKPPRHGIPPNELKLLMSANEVVGERYDWSVVAVGADKAHKKGVTGKGVVVAGLDTGVQKTHPDLTPIDKVQDQTASASGADDRVGHGTHISGTISSRINAIGFVGVAPECTYRHYKVLGDTGSGGVDDIAAGVLAAVADGADVISMSLGGGGADSYIPPAFQKGHDAGVLIFVAAGNDGNANGVSYPGRYPTCFAVAAVDSNLQRAGFSNGGPEVALCCPGVNVRSTYPGNQYAYMSGTSMATPVAAGVGALWIHANPQVAKKDRPAAFKKWLEATAKDLGAAGRDNLYGIGFPDCTTLALGTPVTPPVTPVTPPAGQVTLAYSDLTAAAQARLLLAGYKDFGLTLSPASAGTKPTAPAPATPDPAPAPTDAATGVGPTAATPATPATPAPAGKRWVKYGTLDSPAPWVLEDAPVPAARPMPANFQFQTIRRVAGQCPGGQCPVR